MFIIHDESSKHNFLRYIIYLCTLPKILLPFFKFLAYIHKTKNEKLFYYFL